MSAALEPRLVAQVGHWLAAYGPNQYFSRIAGCAFALELAIEGNSKISAVVCDKFLIAFYRVSNYPSS
ncbi:MAG: hypothetical protein JWQ24_2410 [Tardiphaga sp.]|nr:hypothetical protein [Tardiphaga sp.]